MNRRFFLAQILAGVAASVMTKASGQQSVDVNPFRVRFEDVGPQAGLTTPTVFGGRFENKYLLESTGCGVAFLDYDNDGWLDIFLVNGATLETSVSPRLTNRLLRNNRDGTFTDVTEKAGLAQSGWGQGACIGDYDNDGFDDLFVTYWGYNRLYHNNGDGTFTDVTLQAGLSTKERGWGSGCSFLDYDRDGSLDLFVARYIDFDIEKAPLPGSGGCTYNGLPVSCGPKGLPKASNSLFRNNGDGTFTDVTRQSGIAKAPPSYGLGVLTGDFNNDGWPDIYVANDSDQSYLFWNNRDGTFSEAALEAGVGTSADGRYQAGMGVAAGDYDRDGLLDIFKTNFSGDLPNLYRNQGGGFFEERTIPAGLGKYSLLLGWGCGFLDADNDGWPDVFYVNGHVYPEVDRLKNLMGYRQPKVLYQNLGNGTFRDASAAAGPAITRLVAGRGCAFGDFDNDGDVDIVINAINELPQLLRCDSASGNNWIKLKLIGVRSNRSAIGARVRCVTGDREGIDEVRSGGSYFSQNDLRIHFGLGKADRVDLLEISWPSGKKDRIENLAVNRIWRIVEGAAPDSTYGASRLKGFLDPKRGGSILATPVFPG